MARSESVGEEPGERLGGSEEAHSRLPPDQPAEDEGITLNSVLPAAAAPNHDHVEADMALERARAELADVALLEAAVYCIAHAPATDTAAWCAPARRLADGLRRRVGADAVTLARRAANALASALVVAGDTVPRLAFWWANAVVLRAAVSRGEAGLASGDLPASWLCRALEHVERSAYERILQNVWWQGVVPYLGGKQRSSDRTQHWLQALNAAERCLGDVAGNSLGAALRRNVLSHCTAKLDAILLNAMLRVGGSEAGPTDAMHDPLGSATLAPGGGRVTFGAGMELKMTVSALREWGSARGLGPEPFALLRAAADLMMLPKEVLVDVSVRDEVCGALGPALVCQLLERFAPDEMAPEPLPEALLPAVRAAATAVSVEASSPVSRAPAPECPYEVHDITKLEVPWEVHKTVHDADLDLLDGIAEPLLHAAGTTARRPSVRSISAALAGALPDERMDLLRHAWSSR